jgi:hypothetical protein
VSEWLFFNDNEQFFSYIMAKESFQIFVFIKITEIFNRKLSWIFISYMIIYTIYSFWVDQKSKMTIATEHKLT